MTPPLCDSIRADLSALLDGELPDPRRSELAQHLASCDACRAELEQLRTVAAELNALPRLAAPRALRAKLAERVHTSQWAAPPKRPVMLRLYVRASAIAAVVALLAFASWTLFGPVEELPHLAPLKPKLERLKAPDDFLAASPEADRQTLADEEPAIVSNLPTPAPAAAPLETAGRPLASAAPSSAAPLPTDVPLPGSAGRPGRSVGDKAPLSLTVGRGALATRTPPLAAPIGGEAPAADLELVVQTRSAEEYRLALLALREAQRPFTDLDAANGDRPPAERDEAAALPVFAPSGDLGNPSATTMSFAMPRDRVEPLVERLVGLAARVDVASAKDEPAVAAAAPDLMKSTETAATVFSSEAHARRWPDDVRAKLRELGLTPEAAQQVVAGAAPSVQKPDADATVTPSAQSLADREPANASTDLPQYGGGAAHSDARREVSSRRARPTRSAAPATDQADEPQTAIHLGARYDAKEEGPSQPSALASWFRRALAHVEHAAAAFLVPTPSEPALRLIVTVHPPGDSVATPANPAPGAASAPAEGAASQPPR